jgi:hypothetical protein
LGDRKGSYGVGVYGKALGSGVSGEGTVTGVWGKATSAAGFGVYGDYYADASRYGYLADAYYGVYGQYSSSGPNGYLGSQTYGAYGQYDASHYGQIGLSNTGAYIRGGDSSDTATQYGINASAYSQGIKYGIYSYAYGYGASNSYGVFGVASGQAGNTGNLYGVYGGVAGTLGTTNYSGYFTGGDGVYMTKLSIGDTTPPAYNTIGTAATGHGLATTNDLIIAGSLEVNANIWYDGAVAGTGTALYINASNQIVRLTSSRKYKRDVTDLTLDREKFMALKPVKFKWNEKTASPGVEDYGLIAEDTEKVAPELAVYNDAGTLESVSYQKVNIMLLKVVQEQQKQIEQLRKEMDGLKKAGDRKDEKVSLVD